MTTKHGSSIITKLRHIIRRMQIAGDCKACDAIEAEAENLLAMDDADDVEIIILREAAAVLNGHGYHVRASQMEAHAMDLGGIGMVEWTAKKLAEYRAAVQREQDSPRAREHFGIASDAKVWPDLPKPVLCGRYLDDGRYCARDVDGPDDWCSACAEAIRGSASKRRALAVELAEQLGIPDGGASLLDKMSTWTDADCDEAQRYAALPFPRSVDMPDALRRIV